MSYPNRVLKKGCAEGLSPSAGPPRRMRVSLRYKFFPLLARKGARGMVEGAFLRDSLIFGQSMISSQALRRGAGTFSSFRVPQATDMVDSEPQANPPRRMGLG